MWLDVKTIGFTSEDTFTGWAHISSIHMGKYPSIMSQNSNVIYFHLTQKID